MPALVCHKCDNDAFWWFGAKATCKFCGAKN